MAIPKILVGDTGLIGRTLCDKIDFDLKFNSSNISFFDSTVEDGCDIYLSCLPAEKWKVNNNTLKDILNIIQIFNYLQTKKYNNIYLFSTIDVYENITSGADEELLPELRYFSYGNNRRFFEILVKDQLTYNKLKVIRLPGLYGKYLKKNIIFDYINNHQCESINLNSTYQWYNLVNLVDDLDKIKDEEREFYNFFPEPLSTKELFSALNASEIGYEGSEVLYNYKTNTTETGYWQDKDSVLRGVLEFVNQNRNK